MSLFWIWNQWLVQIGQIWLKICLVREGLFICLILTEQIIFVTENESILKSKVIDKSGWNWTIWVKIDENCEKRIHLKGEGPRGYFHVCRWQSGLYMSPLSCHRTLLHLKMKSHPVQEEGGLYYLFFWWQSGLHLSQKMKWLHLSTSRCHRNEMIHTLVDKVLTDERAILSNPN